MGTTSKTLVRSHKKGNFFVLILDYSAVKPNAAKILGISVGNDPAFLPFVWSKLGIHFILSSERNT